jgi:hypothetical protein
MTLCREVSGATTLETLSGRTTQFRGKSLVLSVIEVDLTIGTSTNVVDTVFEHQFLRHTVLVKRTIDKYTTLNGKWGILPCPDGTYTIHVLLEAFLQVFGSTDIILSILQLKDIQSLHRRIHAVRVVYEK